jgi:hypothetical protein
MTTATIIQNGSVGPGQPLTAVQPAGRETNTGLQPTRDLNRRLQDRRDRTKDPTSILILHRTTEGRILSNLLFPFDKIVQRLRRGAGDQVPMETVHAVQIRIENWMEQCRALLQSFGVGNNAWQWKEPASDIHERMELAGRKNAVVIVPRVQDTAKVVPLIRALDDTMLRIRMEAEDLSKYKDQFRLLGDLVVGLHQIIQHGARVTDTEYRINDDLGKLLRQNAPAKDATPSAHQP